VDKAITAKDGEPVDVAMARALEYGVLPGQVWHFVVFVRNHLFFSL
jgi:hypothetical protein